MEEVIASQDPELINKKRGAIQERITSIEKSLRRLLARSAGKFDHGKIPRIQGQSEHEGLKKHQEDFKILYEAYLEYGMDDDIKEESPEIQEQMKLYMDEQDGFYESLQLYVDYEESYKIYKAALPDHVISKKEAKEESMLSDSRKN